MIDLLPSDEQQLLIDGAADFLLDRTTSRGTDDSSQSAATPSFLAECGALGWFGISLPEDDGGSGLTAVDETLIFRELGRNLVPGPFVGTVIGALLATAESTDRKLAEHIVRGSTPCGLAEVSIEGRITLWDGAAHPLVIVLDRHQATARLVEWRTPPHPRLIETIDPDYQVGEVVVPDFYVLASNERDRAADLIARALVLTSAMQTGIAEATRDRSASYARERVQFGRPIGAFQAVKHRCADMALRAEAAWAQTAVAALRLSQPGPLPWVDVAAAKIVATDSAISNARDNIQNHGGIGYTAEHDAHLFLKRAHILGRMIGAPRSYFDVMLTPDHPQ
jgi:alkylation response protein AidB-like acyl-CoA dehydrogenase